MAIGKEVAPFAGCYRISDVHEAVEKEDPHKHKMKGHSFGEAVGDVQRFVKRCGEEGKQDVVSQVDLVDIVGPIDQHAAPDHHGQDREVDPVHPADGEGMFGDNFFHVIPW